MSAPQTTPGLNARDPTNTHGSSTDFGGLAPHKTLISKPSLLYNLKSFQGFSPTHSMSGAGLWYPQLGTAQAQQESGAEPQNRSWGAGDGEMWSARGWPASLAAFWAS